MSWVIIITSLEGLVLVDTAMERIKIADIPLQQEENLPPDEYVAPFSEITE
jgi:hypothetical protein